MNSFPGDFFQRYQQVFVLSGAGLSTASGIPAYRDCNTRWLRAAPVDLRDFTRSELTRQRYWARSLIGWPRLAASQPNRGHQALAGLEALGLLSTTVTQNVDGLHQKAGSAQVIDLHGRLDMVRCLRCTGHQSRRHWQQALHRANPGWLSQRAATAPDGDADLEGVAFERFSVPGCPACGGLMKPDVVLYGESVPQLRLARARKRLSASDALLVVGSSLMVLSGLRFIREARAQGLPAYAINLGRTRADTLLSGKLQADCSQALAGLLESAPGHANRP